MRVEVNLLINSMDNNFNIIPHINRNGFTHISTENGTGYILTVNLRYASGGYLIFEVLHFS